jgi:hypothetical protein
MAGLRWHFPARSGFAEQPSDLMGILDSSPFWCAQEIAVWLILSRLCFSDGFTNQREVTYLIRNRKALHLSLTSYGPFGSM